MFVTQGRVVRGKNLPALKALVVSLTRWTSSSPLITREVWVDLVILTPRIFNSSVTLIYSRGELACFQPLHLPNASSWHFYVWGSLCSLLPEDFSKNEMMWSSVLNSSCDLRMHFKSSTNPKKNWSRKKVPVPVPEKIGPGKKYRYRYRKNLVPVPKNSRELPVIVYFNIFMYL